MFQVDIFKQILYLNLTVSTFKCRLFEPFVTSRLAFADMVLSACSASTVMVWRRDFVQKCFRNFRRRPLETMRPVSLFIIFTLNHICFGLPFLHILLQASSLHACFKDVFLLTSPHPHLYPAAERLQKISEFCIFSRVSISVYVIISKTLCFSLHFCSLDLPQPFLSLFLLPSLPFSF